MSSIATVEIRSFSGPDLVELDGVNRPAIIRLNVGPRGATGPNSVTSATTSDGTCDLVLDTLQVGDDLTTSGLHSAAIGLECVASGEFSVATGNQTTASAEYSFATGTNTVASGIASFASGDSTTASEGASFAIGFSTTASGPYSFAGGSNSLASAEASYAYGVRAKAIHIGASVESDSQAADVESTTTDEKTLRFANGYRFLGGSAYFEGTVLANHIHGNLAGSVYAHIRAGEELAKGDPVYISGSHGTAPNLIPIVSKADASNPAKMPAIGIMDAALANNANGHMVITGTIADLNTAAYAVNDTLYVATGGGLTATPPAANSQPVARVERSNANNGALIVKVNGLASNGGNGVSDANKLVRFSSTGGISQTGGTMTDTTYAGTASFTSTTRPTSAGTGTPAATSLMTRDDVGIESFFNLGQVFRYNSAPTFATSGTGAVAVQNTGSRWINLGSGSTTTSWGRANIAQGINSNPPASGAIPFGRRMGVAIVGFILADTYTNNGNIFRLRVGSDGTPTADGSDPVTYRGFGIEIKPRGTSHDWRVYGHNGTAITYSAWTNTGLSAQTLSQRFYASVISDGTGNITGYFGINGSRNLASLSITGGPTSNGTGAQSFIDVHVANGPSYALGLGVVIQDSLFLGA
jgi:hypothetical protein